jgi:imidazolonepropionase-like amidohydrolase/Tol biopolymer transport system component
MKLKLFLGTYLFFNLSIHAQNKDVNKWDVNTPSIPNKTIEFTVDEGTWMNVDVSPDGKTIVFDLLGDIYTLPVNGGEAKLLKGGHAWEVQPRFSPDGSKILFTSDAGGGDNIWVMDKNGENAKQITNENFRLLNNAVWMPDGNYIVARKHFTGTRSLGAGEMWMYHISGGEGVQLTKRKNDQQDVNEPHVSPDGKHLYYSEDMYPGGYFQYNKDPNKQIYVIKRYHFETGENEIFISGSGGAMRPQVSRDGKYLAYIRRIRENTCLMIRDLENGEEWMAYDQLSKDQQEAWAIFGVYTGYNWLPDNKNIIIWSGGKIRKINVFTTKGAPAGVAAQNDVIIPFLANCKHSIVEALRFKQNVAPEKFNAKVIRHAVTSPNEKFIVFNAAGYLWRKDLPNGKPTRLTTQQNDHEFEPFFSPNGEELLYVTWNDENAGAVCKYNFKTRQTIKLTKKRAIYRLPRYNNKGDKIVFMVEEGNEDQGFGFEIPEGIYITDKAFTETKRILKNGTNAMFSADDKRIFYLASGFPNVQFKSVDLNGENELLHFTSRYANDFVPSPDNQWVAFRELHNVYVAAFPPSGSSIELHAKTNAVPVAKLSKDAGINMHWCNSAKKICWTLGDEYYTQDLNEVFTFLNANKTPHNPAEPNSIKIELELDFDIPQSLMAFTGATIITMKGDEIIENGTIIIKNNRIEAIGKAAEINIPANAMIIDAKGKTIMPGLVDVHAHVRHFRYGLTTQKHWPYYANLAYGVTTTHDPSTNTETVFALAELVKSGAMVGPRIFSTGTILYGADGDFKTVINNLDDARSAIKRTMAFGAFSVKSYNQPRRDQRQQIIQAAYENKCMVVPEGGSTFYHNMTMILDGHTGIEHNIPVAPAYNDVINLWKNSQTGYTPTLIVCYGAVSGENYWYQKTNVWEKTRLLNFTPRVIIDSRSRHRTMIPDSEYKNGHILVSKTCKKLADEGVKVNMGAHGQLQGLGAHWEIWMLTQGGMSNHDALKAATINGAHYIGIDHEIGSLEKGKLADLIVLEKNPLDNIYNTESIIYTMVNGRLYDAENMDELTAKAKKYREKFYWELPNYQHNFKLNTETNTFERPKCVCGKH